MLNPQGVIISDRPVPLFPYALDTHDQMARAFEPYIACHYSDEEAWEALFTDEQRLATFKAVYGNRKGGKRRWTKPKPKAAQLDLFDYAAHGHKCTCRDCRTTTVNVGEYL